MYACCLNYLLISLNKIYHERALTKGFNVIRIEENFIKKMRGIKLTL